MNDGRLGALAASLMIFACGPGQGPTDKLGRPAPIPEGLRLVVTPETLVLQPGTTARLHVELVNNNSSETLEADVLGLSTSRPDIAALDGLSVTARRTGRAAVTVAFMNMSRQVPIEVTDELPIEWTAIRLEPSQITVAAGAQTPFEVWGTTADGQVLSALGRPELALTIGDPEVARIREGRRVEGRIAERQTVLHAALGAVEAQVPVHVFAEIVALEIDVPSTLPPGSIVPIRVMGVGRDGARQDVSLDPRLSLTSEDPRVMAVAGGHLLVRNLRWHEVWPTNHPGHWDTQLVARLDGIETRALLETNRSAPDQVQALVVPQAAEHTWLAPGMTHELQVHARTQSGAHLPLQWLSSARISAVGPLGLEQILMSRNPYAVRVHAEEVGRGQVTLQLGELRASRAFEVGAQPVASQPQTTLPNILASSTGYPVDLLAWTSAGQLVSAPADEIQITSDDFTISPAVTGTRFSPAGHGHIRLTHRGLTVDHEVEVYSFQDAPVIGLRASPEVLQIAPGERQWVQIVANTAADNQLDISASRDLRREVFGPIRVWVGPQRLTVERLAPGPAAVVFGRRDVEAVVFVR